MNKKFLSAILFGALMVTSTGTFVSCKDYDDDIDSINKELTDIKSQIAALQNKVDAGNYVTNITKAENGINVAFSNGTTSFVETATKVEIEKIETATIVDGEWVITKVDGSKVETGIPASGVLVTGSEATGYVLSVVNAAGDITEVKLPTAASTLKSVEVVNGLFTGVGTAASTGIYWGYNASKVDWAGPLGTVAAKQLLVGQISKTQVKVAPVSYDLGVQELSFVDNKGNVAPVTVTATANGGEWLTTGSRAADLRGEWNLAIKMTSDVNIDNIAKAFTAGGSNKYYALAVNGAVVTDYKFVIDTYTNTQMTNSWTQTYNSSSVKVNGAAVSANAYAYGKTYYVSYAESSLADAYLSFANADKAAAELAGVTVDGLAINVPATAANKTFTFTLNLLGTNGTKASGTFNMTFKPSTVESGSTLAATTYTLTADASKQFIDIKVADFFKGMTAAEVAAYNSWTLTEAYVGSNVQEGFLLSSYTATLHKANSNGTINTTAFTPAAGNADVTNVAYIRIPVANIASDAKPGDYNLILTLAATNGNEVKKATVPVTIALPAFADIYPASAAWEGTKFTTKVLKGAQDYYIDLSTAYNVKANYPMTDLDITAAKVGDVEMIGDKNVNSPAHLILKNVVKDAAFRTTELAATASYKFYGMDKFEVKSEFTIGLVSQFEAPKLVYYVDGVAQETAVLGANHKIATLTTDANNKKQGLAIQYGKGEQAFLIGNVVDGVKLCAAAATVENNEVKTAASIKDVTAATATIAASTDSDKALVIAGVNEGTLVVKFTDKLGITTTATIAFK